MIEVERALIAQRHSAVNCSGCSRGIARSRANIHDTLRAVLSDLQDAARRSLSNACAIRHRQRTVPDRTDIDFSNIQERTGTINRDLRRIAARITRTNV